VQLRNTKKIASANARHPFLGSRTGFISLLPSNHLQIRFTILCTSGATKNAVGKAIRKIIKNARIQIIKNCGTRPTLIKAEIPVITKVIINAIKNGKRTRGVFSLIIFLEKQIGQIKRCH